MSLTLAEESAHTALAFDDLDARRMFLAFHRN
jgi:hypothetical protein